jgi:deazaflavin-dependent oxidoreductase (nitroreductase family)
MHLPRFMARTNRAVTNRVMAPIVGRSASFGVIHHIGRRSGRGYSTPVRVLGRRDGRVMIPIGYGLESDWVRNVLVAQSFTLTQRGRDIRVTEVKIVPAEGTGVGRALRPEAFLVGRRHGGQPRVSADS